MRCPFCASMEDKVLDTRMVEDGAVIRRRRSCDSCSRRFSTLERIVEITLTVVKRSGSREPFERAKIMTGLSAALKNRPFDELFITALASDIEEELRSEGDECASSDIGIRALAKLAELDEVGYLRFASVYKGFEELGDFEREAFALRIHLPTLDE